MPLIKAYALKIFFRVLNIGRAMDYNINETNRFLRTDKTGRFNENGRLDLNFLKIWGI
jgi:hypothetical protein